MNYGKRNCLTCHKEFVANYPGQVTCSNECRISRRNERKQISEYKRNAAANELEWANCHIGTLLGYLLQFGNIIAVKDKRLNELEKENQELRAKIAKTQASETPKPALKEVADIPKPARKKRVCANCGDSFESRDPKEKFCCPDCRLEARKLGLENV